MSSHEPVNPGATSFSATGDSSGSRTGKSKSTTPRSSPRATQATPQENDSAAKEKPLAVASSAVAPGNPYPSQPFLPKAESPEPPSLAAPRSLMPPPAGPYRLVITGAPGKSRVETQLKAQLSLINESSGQLVRGWRWLQLQPSRSFKHSREVTRAFESESFLTLPLLR